MKKILPAIFLLLISCSNQQYNHQSQAQISYDRMNDSLRIRDALTKECCAKVNQLPDSKIVHDQILYEKEDSPNKIALMSSSQKTSASQNKSLLQYLKDNQECRDISINTILIYPSLPNPSKNFYGDMDIVYANLISNKITISR